MIENNSICKTPGGGGCQLGGKHPGGECALSSPCWSQKDMIGGPYIDQVLVLRIDTGVWGVIGIIVCISCSIRHGITYNIPYERSFFSLFNNINHDDID